MRELEYHDEGPMEGEAEDVTGVSKVDAAGLNSPGRTATAMAASTCCRKGGIVYAIHNQ